MIKNIKKAIAVNTKEKVLQAIAKAGIDVLDKDLVKIIKENMDSGVSPQDSFVAAHKLLEVPMHKDTVKLVNLIKRMNPENDNYRSVIHANDFKRISSPKWKETRREIKFKRAKALIHIANKINNKASGRE